MTARKHPPKLLMTSLTGQVYIVTRYTQREAKNGTPYIVAHEKFDVTEEFQAIEMQRVLDRAEQGDRAGG
jgi:hypothetical protein